MIHNYDQKFREITKSCETQHEIIDGSLISRIKFYQRCLDKLVKTTHLPKEEAMFRRWFELNVGLLQEN